MVNLRKLMVDFNTFNYFKEDGTSWLLASDIMKYSYEWRTSKAVLNIKDETKVKYVAIGTLRKRYFVQVGVIKELMINGPDQIDRSFSELCRKIQLRLMDIPHTKGERAEKKKIEWEIETRIPDDFSTIDGWGSNSNIIYTTHRRKALNKSCREFCLESKIDTVKVASGKAGGMKTAYPTWVVEKCINQYLFATKKEGEIVARLLSRKIGKPA